MEPKMFPDDGVEVLSYLYPGLLNTRFMKCLEIDDLLRRHNRLSRFFRTVSPAYRTTFLLEKGQGVQIFLTSWGNAQWCLGELLPQNVGLHAVVLYRGRDGHYCFFDSGYVGPPSQEIKDAVGRSGSGTIFHTTRHHGLQGWGMGTCLYYCAAFMSFVAYHRNMPTEYLIPFFEQFTGPQSDEQVVRVTQQLFREAHLPADFTITDPWDLSLHIELPSTSLQECGPGHEDQLVNILRRRLTPTQTSRLLASVTVTEVSTAGSSSDSH